MAQRAGAPISRGGAATFRGFPRSAPAPRPIALPGDGDHLFRALFEQAADGIVLVDEEGRIVLANERCTELMGYGPDEILGLSLLDTYLPAEREIGRLRLRPLGDRSTLRFERMLLRKDGATLPIDVSTSWLPTGARLSIFHDISARKAAEEARRLEDARLEAELSAVNAALQKILADQETLQAELAYRALHDPLTGLANRAMFQERLDYAFRVSKRGVAVVWMDLDRFKEVNDIFGHEVGDEMLVAVADRLRDVLRESDDIARLGGDEFAVVLPNVVESEAQMIGERILQALTNRDAFRLQVGASLGVAWQPSTDSDRASLVRRADEAMYRAKALGGGVSVLS